MKTIRLGPGQIEIVSLARVCAPAHLARSAIRHTYSLLVQPAADTRPGEAHGRRGAPTNSPTSRFPEDRRQQASAPRFDGSLPIMEHSRASSSHDDKKHRRPVRKFRSQRRLSRAPRSRRCPSAPMDNNTYRSRALHGKSLLIDAANDAGRIPAAPRRTGAGTGLIVTTASASRSLVRARRGRREDRWPTAAHPLDSEILSVAPTRSLEGGDTVTVGDLTLEVIPLSGHTPGGITLARAPRTRQRPRPSVHGRFAVSRRCRQDSGRRTVASLRTDVESSSFARFPDETVFYPGHGKDSTLAPSGPTWANGANAAGDDRFHRSNASADGTGVVLRTRRNLQRGERYRRPGLRSVSGRQAEGERPCRRLRDGIDDPRGDRSQASRPVAFGSRGRFCRHRRPPW